MLARPPAADPRVKSLCSELGIEIIPANKYPLPGQTRAVASIRRLIDHHGEAHARLVLTVFAECEGNNALADETSIGAVSDVFLAMSGDIEERVSVVLDILDRAPIGPFMCLANELRGIVLQRAALAGMLYAYLRQHLGDRLAAQAPSAALHRRSVRSEGEKGREVRDGRCKYTPAEKIAIGRRLLAAKASLGHGKFLPWLQDQDIAPDMAHKCMKLAKAATDV